MSESKSADEVRLWRENEELRAEIERLKKKNAILKPALVFYGREETYISRRVGEIILADGTSLFNCITDIDNGITARQALKEVEEMK